MAFPKFESFVPVIPDINFGKCEAAGNFVLVPQACGLKLSSSFRPGSASPSMTVAISCR